MPLNINSLKDHILIQGGRNEDSSGSEWIPWKGSAL